MARCWFSDADCQTLKHVLSEPNRFALKLSQRQDDRVIKAARTFNSLSLAKRKYTLQKAYMENIWDARRTQFLMRICLRGLILMGYRGYTLKQIEDTLAAQFNDSYDELKHIFEREFSFIPMTDIVGNRLDVGEIMVEYFWDSLVAEKELPLTPTIKNSLGIDDDKLNNSPIDTLNSLLTMFLERDKAGKLRPEAKHFAKSMILSWVNEEYQKNRGRSETAMNKAIMEGIVHRATVKEDAEGRRTIIGPEDRQATEDFEQADRYLLLRNVLEGVSDPIDRKAFSLYWKHELGDLSDTQYEQEAAKYGLTTKAIDHRLRDLTRKYPILQQYKE